MGRRVASGRDGASSSDRAASQSIGDGAGSAAGGGTGGRSRDAGRHGTPWPGPAAGPGGRRQDPGRGHGGGTGAGGRAIEDGAIGDIVVGGARPAHPRRAGTPLPAAGTGGAGHARRRSGQPLSGLPVRPRASRDRRPHAGPLDPDLVELLRLARLVEPDRRPAPGELPRGTSSAQAPSSARAGPSSRPGSAIMAGLGAHGDPLDEHLARQLLGELDAEPAHRAQLASWPRSCRSDIGRRRRPGGPPGRRRRAGRQRREVTASSDTRATSSRRPEAAMSRAARRARTAWSARPRAAARAPAPARTPGGRPPRGRARARRPGAARPRGHGGHPVGVAAAGGEGRRTKAQATATTATRRYCSLSVRNTARVAGTARAKPPGISSRRARSSAGEGRRGEGDDVVLAGEHGPSVAAQPRSSGQERRPWSPWRPARGRSRDAGCPVTA